MNDEKIKFAIYSRKSKFTEKGDSIENQIKMCRDYIDINFMGVNKDIFVYEDEGFSGKNLNRPEFQKMMRDCKFFKFNYIVVYRLDRISRNVGDFANLTEELTKYQTSFICIKEQFDTSTPMGRAMMNIAMVFAQLERETIAERIKDNMHMMSKDGKWNGGHTPLGYKSIKHTCFENGKTKKYCTLAFDEEQIGLVKIIFNKYKELRSISSLEKYMLEKKYLTQNGKDWNKTNLKRVLTNPVYCIADIESYNYFKNLGCNICFNIEDCDGERGLISYNKKDKSGRANPYEKWIIAISEHKGLFTGKEWLEIQEIIKNNATLCWGGKQIGETKRTFNKEATLSGILKCKCGAWMRPKKNGSNYMFYMCTKKEKSKKKDCDIRNLNAYVTDNLVLDEIFSFDKDGSIINKQIKRIKEENSKANKNVDNEYKKLLKKKDDNNKAINNLVVTLSMNVSSETISVINNQITALTLENNEIDIKLKELEYDAVKKNEKDLILKDISETINYMKNNFNNLSIENRRNLLKKIIERVEWDGENIDIFIKNC